MSAPSLDDTMPDNERLVMGGGRRLREWKRSGFRTLSLKKLATCAPGTVTFMCSAVIRRTSKDVFVYDCTAG